MMFSQHDLCAGFLASRPFEDQPSSRKTVRGRPDRMRHTARTSSLRKPSRPRTLSPFWRGVLPFGGLIADACRRQSGLGHRVAQNRGSHGLGAMHGSPGDGAAQWDGFEREPPRPAPSTPTTAHAPTPRAGLAQDPAVESPDATDTTQRLLDARRRSRRRC